MRIKLGTKVYTKHVKVREGKFTLTSMADRGIEYLSLYIGKVSMTEHPSENQIESLLNFAGFYTKAQIKKHLGTKTLMALENAIEQQTIKTIKTGEQDGKSINTSFQSVLPERDEAKDELTQWKT